jgi:cell division protein FtsZ
MADRGSTDETIGTRTDGDLEPRIVVAGCGGAGCNVVSQVYEKDLPGVETLAVNTDAGALHRTSADVRILLAQGVAVDGDPQLAEFAAEACRDLFKSATSADIVFLVAGLGGATGTGAAPVLADAAKDAGAHVVGIAILPFAVEGRGPLVDEGIARLKAACDSVVVLDNNNLGRLGEGLALREAFAFMNRVVLTIIEGVLEHLSSAVMTSVMDEVETVAREMQGEPASVPVEVATPVIEAAAQFEPVAFDSTGFIGYR